MDRAKPQIASSHINFDVAGAGVQAVQHQLTPGAELLGAGSTHRQTAAVAAQVLDLHGAGPAHLEIRGVDLQIKITATADGQAGRGNNEIAGTEPGITLLVEDQALAGHQAGGRGKHKISSLEIKDPAADRSGEIKRACVVHGYGEGGLQVLDAQTAGGIWLGESYAVVHPCWSIAELQQQG